MAMCSSMTGTSTGTASTSLPGLRASHGPARSTLPKAFTTRRAVILVSIFTYEGTFRVRNIEYPIRAYQVADAPAPAWSLRFRAGSHSTLLSLAAFGVVLAMSGLAWFPDVGPAIWPRSATIAPDISVGIAPPGPASAAPPNSIVVLPFRNFSGRPEEEYV